MAASDHLNKRLFHGAGGAIEGGVVNPNEGKYGKAAYASTNFGTASGHAVKSARNEGRLFGVVYEVKPVSQTPKVKQMYSDDGINFDTYVIDPEGLQVMDAVHFPINEEGLYAEDDRAFIKRMSEHRFG